MDKEQLIRAIQEKITDELEAWKDQILDDVVDRFYSIKDALYDDINEAIIEVEQNESKRIN